MTRDGDTPAGVDLPDDVADLAAGRLLAVSEPERTAALAELVNDYPQYATALRSLCADLGDAERLLDSTYPEHPVHGNQPPTHIGGHRVLRRLGEGAFGIVYLCAQREPVVRDVAIKVLRPGVGDPKTLQRFAVERQLLASLNHPAITQVFDAGKLPDGRPFFVMEYVDGLPLRRYCDDRGLLCQQRLRLFVDVCRGVAHAHGRGIVHRDLKPANVLVVDTENGPAPKIIDFGIAKALFPVNASDGPRTDAGRVIGTPGYMSPEQAAGNADVADARADVFALGVLLYELLTGHLPWTQGAAATDAEPMRPSARVTTSTGAIASAQPTQRRQLAAELRGDLDWITLKALAREREDRYTTVAAMVDDIERHLRGVPVSVGPPSATYRLRKFVRRNRAAVWSLGGAVMLVSIGLFLALAYGRAADAAVQQAQQTVANSLADTAAVVDRLLARANDPDLRDAPRGDAARQALLSDALSFYERFLRERPTDPALRVGRCHALLSIAEVHGLLGEMTRAESVAAESVGEARAMLAGEPQNLQYRGLLGEALRQQGHALAFAGNHAAAQPILAAAVTELGACATIAPETYGRSHATALREAANALESHLVEPRLAGMRASLQVLDTLRREHSQIAGLAEDRLQACFAVAVELFGARKFEDAGAMLTIAEKEMPTITSDRNNSWYSLRRQQGRVAWELGDRKKAILRFREAADAATAWQREQPQRLRPQEALARALRDLGWAQNYVGAFAESATSFRSAIAQADATVQQFPNDPSRMATLCRMLREFARILWDRSRYVDLAEAAACAARATEVNDRIATSVDVERQPRWQLLTMEAEIQDSLGHNDVTSIWTAVEAELPTDPSERVRQDQDLLVEACTGLAKWHIAHGRNESAAAFLTLAREGIERNKPISNKRMVEVGWLEARLAALRGDCAEVAATADRILAARSTWFGTRRAADCLHLAWRCATAGPPDGAGAASGYRDRAAELYGRVMQTLSQDIVTDPEDPWYVLPWGFASVRAAELAAAADPETARRLLAASLPKLAAVRAAAQVDQWEDQTFRDGKELQRQLGETKGK
jgi:predicted Ser/Thr protein kinase